MNISVLLTGHAEWSKGMLSAYHLIIGEDNSVDYLNFSLGTAKLEDYHQEMAEKIKALAKNSDELWILTDILGGYPFQAAAQISFGQSNVRVFGGVNMPFLLALATEKDSIEDPISFISELLELSRQALIPFEIDTSPSRTIEDDGI
ncbi:MAG: PTS sugar transporter subunit IIA [Brevinema sp.]